MCKNLPKFWSFVSFLLYQHKQGLALLLLLEPLTTLYLSEIPAQALTFHSMLKTSPRQLLQMGEPRQPTDSPTPSLLRKRVEGLGFPNYVKSQTTPELLPNVNSQTSNAHLLLQQGVKFYNSQQFSEAIQIFLQAVSAFKNQGDSLNLALTWRYLSLAYQHLGQWQQASQAITQSLTLLNQQKNTTRDQVFLDVLAKTLNTQARLQFVQGQYSEALETWKIAATIYKQSGNNTALVGILINKAEALQASGLSNRAETELQNVEQIIHQLQDPQLKVHGLQSLGKTYRRVGDLGKSQAVLLKGLAMVRYFRIAQAEASILLELGNTEQALTKQAIAIGDKEQGEKHTQDAIGYYRQVANYPSKQLEAQLNLLSLLVDIENFSSAVKLLPSIEQLIANLPPSQTGIYAQLNFAQSLTKLSRRVHGTDWYLENLSSTRKGGVKSIAKILANAVQQARIIKNKTAESYALGQLGGLYELTKQWSQAQNLTQQALLLAEEMQNPDIRYRWQWQLGRLWEKQGQIKAAIAAYEGAVQTLKSIKGDLLTINSDIQFSFQENVEPIYRSLVDLLLRTEGDIQPSQKNLDLAVEIIDSLRLAELENFLRCKLSYAQLNQDINKFDQTAAFIYPIILSDRIEIIFKLPGQNLKRYVTSVEQAEVDKTAMQLRSNILKRNYPEAVIEKATQLYNWLILPLESDLKNNKQVKTLVFVPDGALRNIPLSVLYDRKNQEYLMQKQYAIALVPDLKLFDLRAFRRSNLNVLTAGVSEEKEVEGRKFNELPSVVKELQQVSNVVASQPLLNIKFTKPNLQQQINSGNFSAVHIATHGKFSSNPEETFILTYNQLLRSNDLNNILGTNSKQNIDLLVLSACQTAQGDKRATLGLAGIAVRAGARSTLATLWQVSDNSTAEVMGYFYKELTNPQVTKAEALQQAQLALFKKYKAPYYWAPYVLVGNWL